MHLANTFIQSNLHCIKFSTFLSINAFPENRIRGLGVANAMLYCLLFCMLTTYAPLVFTVPPTPPLSLPRPLTLSFVSRRSGSLCPGPCGGLNVFSLHTWVSPSCPSLPHSLSLLLQWECIRRVWTWEKHTGRRNSEDCSSLTGIIADFLARCVCACQQVQCLPRHNSRWAAGGDALLFCSLSSCCPWHPGLGMPPSTSHPNVSTGFYIAFNMHVHGECVF